MLIDFHTHIFSDAIASKAIPHLASICHLPPQTSGTAADTLLKMDQWKVDYSVFHNIATKPNQEDTINDCALQLKEDRLIPFAALHYQSDHVLDRLQTIKDNGFIGIKLHPDYQEFMIDNEALYPIYDTCSQLGLYVMFHAGVDFISPDLVHAPPQKSYKILKEFPHLKVILAHLGGFSMWDDVLELLAGQSVYMDTSMCAGRINPITMQHILQKHDPNQILFGSDCPWQSAEVNLSFLKSLRLSDQYLEKITYQNAMRILNIS